MIFIFDCMYRVYANLTATEMVLYIVRGINLPAPSGIEGPSKPFLYPGGNMLKVYSHLAPPLASGVSPNDLDASVKFEFPFPSSVRLL